MTEKDLLKRLDEFGFIDCMLGLIWLYSIAYDIPWMFSWAEKRLMKRFGFKDKTKLKLIQGGKK